MTGKDRRKRWYRRLTNFVLPFRYFERRRHQWLILALATAVALVVGQWGFNLYDRKYGVEPNWSDNLFRSVVLLRLRLEERHQGLATPENPHSLPWQLHVARVFVPLTLTLFGLLALAAFLRVDYRRRSARWARGHIILCGDPVRTEAVAKALCRFGHKIVMIRPEDAVEEGRLSYLEEAGMVLAGGSARDQHTLIQSGIRRARALIALEDSETENLEVLLTAKALLIEKNIKRAPPLQGIAGIQSPAFYRRMLASSLPPFDCESMSMRVFSEPTAIARRVWSDLSWYGQFRLQDDDVFHAVIVGFGDVGQSLVLRICSQAHLPGVATRSITVLAPGAEPNAESLRGLAPWAEQLASVRFVEFDPAAITYESFSSAVAGPGIPGPHLVYVCPGDDDQAFRGAMDLADFLHSTPMASAHIKVMLNHRPHLVEGLRQSKRASGRFVNLSFFGDLEDLYHPETLLDEVTDTLARAIHRHYCETFGSLIEPWERLSESLRDANRQQADSAVAKAISLGLSLQEGQSGTATLEPTPGEIEMLARLEHDRWVSERLSKGWRRGEQRNDPLKIHPSLSGYDELSEPEKDKDRNAVRSLFGILSESGTGLVRQGYVCLLPRAGARVEQAMAFLQDRCSLGERVILVSPLASEMDRVIAMQALAEFDVTLSGLIPVIGGIPRYGMGTSTGGSGGQLLDRLQGTLFVPLNSGDGDPFDGDGHLHAPLADLVCSVLEDRLDCACWRG